MCTSDRLKPGVLALAKLLLKNRMALDCTAQGLLQMVHRLKHEAHSFAADINN